jgi:hypothetical protein
LLSSGIKYLSDFTKRLARNKVATEVTAAVKTTGMILDFIVNLLILDL